MIQKPHLGLPAALGTLRGHNGMSGPLPGFLSGQPGQWKNSVPISLDQRGVHPMPSGLQYRTFIDLQDYS